MKCYPREPRAGGEGTAGVDHRHVIAQLLGNWDDTLRDVHGSDDDQPQRRIVDVDELALVAPRLVEAEGLVELLRKRVLRGPGARHDALLSRFEGGDQRHRLAIGPRRQQMFE